MKARSGGVKEEVKFLAVAAVLMMMVPFEE